MDFQGKKKSSYYIIKLHGRVLPIHTLGAYEKKDLQSEELAFCGN